MKRYKAKLKHDHGTQWIQINSPDFDSAVRMICEIEKCPSSAILEMHRVETVTYHRKPTNWEIEFGEGATHYAEFNREEVTKADGTLKKWTICKYTGLRYYR